VVNHSVRTVAENGPRFAWLITRLRGTLSQTRQEASDGR
jgi:hypothetical protein